MAYFTSCIKDENIYDIHFPEKPLGVTTYKYNLVVEELNALIPVFNEYQQLLITLGKEHGKQYIKVPVNQEELLQQLFDDIQELKKTVSQLTNKEVAE